MSIVLGIETSCDETSIGVVKEGHVLSNIIATQVIHDHFGGVVPELAARDHIRNLMPVATEALQKAKISLTDIDLVACTHSPGLIGCLMVGSQFAKSVALSLRKPFYAINHLYAHVASPFIHQGTTVFPYLCLLVSGGHTQIVLCESWTKMSIVGETLDDAAGEAFDKSARLLGYNSNGGKWIDTLSEVGDYRKFPFPLIRIPEYNFSFSGLKTAVRYLVEREQKKYHRFIEENKNDLCASIQFAIVESLLIPLFAAAEKMKIPTICLAGGVSANRYLRRRLQEEVTKRAYECYIPLFEFCTDNGAMIAFLAEKWEKGQIPYTPINAPCYARSIRV